MPSKVRDLADVLPIGPSATAASAVMPLFILKMSVEAAMPQNFARALIVGYSTPAAMTLLPCDRATVPARSIQQKFPGPSGAPASACANLIPSILLGKTS